MAASSTSQKNLAVVGALRSQVQYLLEKTAEADKVLNELKQAHADELKQMRLGYDSKRREQEGSGLHVELALARAKSRGIKDGQKINEMQTELDKTQLKMARAQGQFREAERTTKRDTRELERLDDQLMELRNENRNARDENQHLRSELDTARLILESMDAPSGAMSNPPIVVRSSGIQPRRNQPRENPPTIEEPVRRRAAGGTPPLQGNYANEAPTVRPRRTDSAPPS